MKRILLKISTDMGTSSPDKVLRNFIEYLKKASPRLKLAIAYCTPWIMLFTAVSKYAWICRGFGALRSYVTNSLYASISIPASHPLNSQILAYMVERGLGKNARTLSLTPPQIGIAKTAYLYPELYGMDPYGRGRSKPKRHADPEAEDKEKQALSYVPDVGKYAFWYNGHRMTFERIMTQEQMIDTKGRVKMTTMQGNETIVISCPSLFSAAKPIQNFLDHIKAAPKKEHTTTIYRPEGQMWDQGITRPSRNLNAVTLDSSVKDAIVNDIETYLAPATRRYYANRGIPWRRGYLFYGNPGCGKTSFTNALAGHFTLNVYMISLSTNNLNDEMLESLFEQLPARCIVLLEDIDSAGIQREDMRAKAKKKTVKKKKVVVNQFGEAEEVNDGPLNITLAGLLNVLDGINSREGHVVIMTSNSPDSLDPALVRPGRIDRKVLFGYASTEVTAKLFKHIFEKSSEELMDGESTASGHDIPKLAEAFAAKLPADRLTPAEVQGYLLVHRADPVAAGDEATEWAERTLETKAKGANVAAFASDGSLQDAAAGSGHTTSNSRQETVALPDDASVSSASDGDSGFEEIEDETLAEGDESHDSSDSRTDATPSMATLDKNNVMGSLTSAKLQSLLKSSGLSLSMVAGVLTPPDSRAPSRSSSKQNVAERDDGRTAKKKARKTVRA